MKNLVVTFLIIIGISFVLFGITVCYVIYEDLDIDKTLANDVLVSSEWIEINSKSPMKISKQTQSVVFTLDGYKFDHSSKGWQFEIKLPDGTIVSPEVQIFDEYGNAYDLQYTGNVNSDVCFTPKEHSKTHTTFPNDRNYTKLRIRSDKPFHISKIIWRDENLK